MVSPYLTLVYYTTGMANLKILMFNYILFLPFKNRAHSPNPKPTELRKEAKEAGKNEHHPDPVVQLRSGELDCQSDGRVQHRMTKAHSLILASSRYVFMLPRYI